MRVCHIAMGDLWAGAEVQLAILASELVVQHDLELSAILFNDGRLASELRALKIPVTVFPESEQSPLRLLQNVTRYCRAHAIDILHSHKYKDTLMGAWAAARCGIPKMVRTVHGLGEPFTGMLAAKMQLYQSLEQVALRWKADRVIAVSQEIQTVLERQLGIGRVRQIHNGIRIDALTTPVRSEKLRMELGLQETDVVLGTVGRLTPVKGHQYLLRAVHQLVKTYDNLHLLIVGDGPDDAALRLQSVELGIQKRVHFLGHREDICELMGLMNVFVLPSLHEGIPMVILEALALGRPIVASDVGGIPEVITSGVHGLLAPAGNPAALAEKCRCLVADPVLAANYAEAGRQRVAQEFSSRAMASQVATVYRELHHGPSSAPDQVN